MRNNKSYRTSLSIIAILLIALLFTTCTPNKKIPGEKFQIVTTTGMIKDAVEHVVKDHADVIALMGPAVDPHLYKASHGDLEKLTYADIVFYNGLHLEGKMGEVMEKLGRLKPVVAVSEQIPQDKLRTAPGFASAHDPHIWFNVELWQNAVKEIVKTMQQQDSVHADEYAANGKVYLKKLDSLHQVTRERILQIPALQRVLITAHDAFGYFGDAYEIEVKGLQGISTVSEFGLKDRVDLVNFIIERKIKAIFVETSVPKRSIEAIVDGCNQQGWPVVIGGSLYSDAMGAEGTPEGTYIGMVNANVTTIVNALK